MFERAKSLLPRPLRLVAVGVSATFAYSIFSLGLVWLAGFSAPLASLLGHSLAGIVSYYGHRIFTFEVTGEHNGAPARFIVLNVTSYLIACFSPWIAVEFFKLSSMTAIFITAIVIPTINVLLISKFVFHVPIMENARTKIEFNNGN